MGKDKGSKGLSNKRRHEVDNNSTNVQRISKKSKVGNSLPTDAMVSVSKQTKSTSRKVIVKADYKSVTQLKPKNNNAIPLDNIDDGKPTKPSGYCGHSRSRSRSKSQLTKSSVDLNQC